MRAEKPQPAGISLSLISLPYRACPRALETKTVVDQAETKFCVRRNDLQRSRDYSKVCLPPLPTVSI